MASDRQALVPAHVVVLFIFSDFLHENLSDIVLYTFTYFLNGIIHRPFLELSV